MKMLFYGKKFLSKLVVFVYVFLTFIFTLFLTNSIKSFYNEGNIIFSYETQKIIYAKAGSDCAIFRTQNLSQNEILFYVPETYFVSLISKISDEVYKVQYSTFTGYALASSFDIVSFTPSNPYLTKITFDIPERAGTQIWSSASSSGKILSTISADTKNIEYIASTIGEIPIGGNSNLWFFARYTPATNVTSVFEGYVYSEATTNLSHIPTNLEIEEQQADTQIANIVNITSPIKAVLIAMIVAPFAILFLLGVIKAIHEKQKYKLNTAQAEETTQTQVQKTFIRKRKSKPVEEEPQEEFEVVFPEYNYIDDDDLL